MMKKKKKKFFRIHIESIIVVVFSWIGSFFESAFKEGWIWYLLGALVILIILMMRCK
jgi:uncharacterized membrane protein